MPSIPLVTGRSRASLFWLFDTWTVSYWDPVNTFVAPSVVSMVTESSPLYVSSVVVPVCVDSIVKVSSPEPV